MIQSAKKKSKKLSRSPKSSSPFKWLLTLALTASVAGGIWYFVRRIPADPPPLPSNVDDKLIVAAVESCRERVRSDPRNAEFWGKMGLTFHAHEFVSQAATCYSEAAKIDPNEPRWPYLQARCVSSTDPHLGIKLLNQSIALGAQNETSPRLFLMELLLENGMIDEAEIEIDLFLQQDPNNWRARHAKARMLFMNGEYLACRETIEAMQSQVKRILDEANSRVKNLVDSRHPAEAARFAKETNKKANSILRMQKSLGLLLARALRQLGEMENAETERQRAERKKDIAWSDPFLTPLHDLRTGRKSMLVEADLAFARNDFDGSIEVLEKTIKEYPDSLYAYTMLGRAYIRKGRQIQMQENSDVARVKKYYNKAERFLSQGRNLDKNSVEVLFRLGVLYTYLAEIENRSHFYERSIAMYQRAVELKDDFTMAYFNLASAQIKMGKRKEAVEALQAAVRSDPNFANGHDKLALLLLSAGQFSEARKHAEFALRLAPNDRQAKKTLEQIRAREFGFRD